MCFNILAKHLYSEDFAEVQVPLVYLYDTILITCQWLGNGWLADPAQQDRFSYNLGDVQFDTT